MSDQTAWNHSRRFFVLACKTMKLKALLPSLIIASLIIGGVIYVIQEGLLLSLIQTTSETDEVHVHSDFLFYIHDTRIDLSDDIYQSSVKGVQHENFHLHDNDQNVLHRHANGLTLTEFLASIDFILTTDCLTTDRAETYCIDETNEIALYVNGEQNEDYLSYIPQEEDQILLYYGSIESPELDSYLSSITDESCIYSGTCPERGLPPPESCGITCEI